MVQAYCHGEYRLEEQQGIIRAYVEGAFNLEGMQLFHRDVSQISVSMGQWALMIVGSKDAMATPEALEAAERFAESLEQAGCVAIAVYNLNQAMSAFSRKVNRKSGLPFLISADLSESECFVRSHLEH